MSRYSDKYGRSTNGARLRRRERRVHNQKPFKGFIMRCVRQLSRFLFGRNVFTWLTDSKNQSPGTKPNPSYKER